MLSIGACLDRIVRRCDIGILGHSRISDLCHARYGFGASQGREYRALAVRLAELPLIRDAFLRGSLHRTKVRDLVTVATVESEPGWTDFALRHGSRDVHRLAMAVKEGRAEPPAPGAAMPDVAPAEGEGVERIDLHVTPAQAAQFRHAGRPMVERIIGHQAPDAEILEALVAETLEEVGPVDPREPHAHEEQELVRVRFPRHGLRDDLFRSWVTRCKTARQASVLPMPYDGPDGTTIEVDRMLRTLVKELHRLEWERGRLLSELSATGGHRLLGYAWIDAYALAELGLSQKETLGALALWNRSRGWRAVHAAWQDGRLAPTRVRLILDVVSAATEHAWVGRARATTFKRLEEEVLWTRWLRDTPTQSARWNEYRGWPPADVASETLRADFTQAYGPQGEVAARIEAACARGDAAAVSTSGAACAAEASPTSGEAADSTSGTARAEGVRAAAGAQAGEGVETSVAACADPAAASLAAADVVAPGPACAGAASLAGERPGGAARCHTVKLSFWVEPDVAFMTREALRKLRERFGAHLTDGECLELMLLLVARAHVWDLEHQDTVAFSVYVRDGWLCQMPGCRSLGPLHAHHVWWRSAGGPDAAWNLLTLCEPCHRLVHAKKVVIVLGKGPQDHVFLFGLLPGGKCREAYRNGQEISPDGFDWRTAWHEMRRLQAA